ncbi:polymorphic outer membrane protein [Planoprotostelium fungivorum]|uniref:Polymorphic outer membrane protein n=1 Tax=Planoprotostelium fungivorum TaxID=1890364 RepID=A0A2P6MV99_9EUKA|nr:polymorphic outer membrane protein [Planoprotostelium fungivorum]
MPTTEKRLVICVTIRHRAGNGQQLLAGIGLNYGISGFGDIPIIDVSSEHSTLFDSFWGRIIIYAAAISFLIYLANAWIPSRLLHTCLTIYYAFYSAGHLSELLEVIIPAETARKIMQTLPHQISKLVASTGRRESARRALSYVIAVIIGLWWSVSESWILNDVLGASTGIIVLSKLRMIRGFKTSLFLMASYCIIQTLSTFIPIIEVMTRQLAILELPQLVYPSLYGEFIQNSPEPFRYAVVYSGQVLFPGIYLGTIMRYEHRSGEDKNDRWKKIISLFYGGPLFLSTLSVYTVGLFLRFLSIYSQSDVRDVSYLPFFVLLTPIVFSFMRGDVRRLLDFDEHKASFGRSGSSKHGGVSLMSVSGNVTVAEFDLYITNGGVMDISQVQNTIPSKLIIIITSSAEELIDESIMAEATSAIDVQMSFSSITCGRYTSMYFGKSLTLRGNTPSLTNLTDCGFVIQGAQSIIIHNINWKTSLLMSPLITADSALQISLIACIIKQAAPVGDVVIPMINVLGDVETLSLSKMIILQAGRIEVGGSISQLSASNSSFALVTPQPDETNSCVLPWNVVDSVMISGSTFDLTGCTMKGLYFEAAQVNISDSIFTKAAMAIMTIYISQVSLQRNQFTCNVSMYDVQAYNNLGNNGGFLSFDLFPGLDSVYIQGLICKSNIARYNGGCIIYDGGNVIIRDSLFQDNLAKVLGGAIGTSTGGYNTRLLDIHYATFKGNTSPVAGGALHIDQAGGIVSISNVTFYNNTGSFSGGAIIMVQTYPQYKYNVTISNVIFLNNSATSGAAISNIGAVDTISMTDCVMDKNVGVEGIGFYSSNTINNLTVARVDFSRHVDGGVMKLTGQTKMFSYGGAIYQIGQFGVVTITNTSFVNTSASYGGSVQFVSMTNNSSISLTGNTFQNSSTTVSGGAIYLSGIETVRMTNNTCTDTLALSTGGCIRLIRSNTSVVMRDNSFVRNTSPKGSAIYADGDNVVTSISCTHNNITNNSAVSGGVMEVSDSVSLSIDSDTITSNKAMYGVYYMTNSSLFSFTMASVTASDNEATLSGSVVTLFETSQQTNNITDSTFSGAGETGGVMHVSATGSQYGISVWNTSMTDNKAATGGAIFISSGSQVNTSLSLYNCILNDNSADVRGAVYASVVTGVTVKKSEMKKNKASGSGGAVYITSEILQPIHKISTGNYHP